MSVSESNGLALSDVLLCRRFLRNPRKHEARLLKLLERLEDPNLFSNLLVQLCTKVSVKCDEDIKIKFRLAVMIIHNSKIISDYDRLLYDLIHEDNFKSGERAKLSTKMAITLLEAGADPEAMIDLNDGTSIGLNSSGTRLHQLCEFAYAGHRNDVQLKYIKKLLTYLIKRTNLSIIDDQGCTALHYLCTQSPVNGIAAKELSDSIIEMVDSGIDLNIQCFLNRATVLHYLCNTSCDGSGTSTMCRRITAQAIIRKINVNITDQCGNTAFHYLCDNYFGDVTCYIAYNAMKIAIYMIGAGVNLNRIGSKGTPLYILCKYGLTNEETVSCTKTVIDKMLTRYINFDLKIQKSSLLHRICEYGFYNEEIVKYIRSLSLNIIGRMKNLNIRDSHGRNPLHLLLQSAFDKYKVAVFAKDVALAMIGRINLNAMDNKGRSILHMLCQYGFINSAGCCAKDIAMSILNREPNVNILDDIKRNPLHVLCEYGFYSASTAKYSFVVAINLIKRCVDLTATDHNRMSPLASLLTCWNESANKHIMKLAKIIITAKGYFNADDRYGVDDHVISKVEAMLT